MRAFRLLFSLAAAILFAVAGIQMLGIESISSDEFGTPSTAEVFYHACGWFSFGLAALSLAFTVKAAIEDYETELRITD